MCIKGPSAGVAIPLIRSLVANTTKFGALALFSEVAVSLKCSSKQSWVELQEGPLDRLGEKESLPREVVAGPGLKEALCTRDLSVKVQAVLEAVRKL